MIAATVASESVSLSLKIPHGRCLAAVNASCRGAAMPGTSRLPSRFPIGTRYVVEGTPGKDGTFRITSRFVVLPNGTELPLPLKPARRVRARAVAARRAARDAISRN